MYNKYSIFLPHNCPRIILQINKKMQQNYDAEWTVIYPKKQSQISVD